MSAELLRRAADVLRKSAVAATAGPWVASPVDSPDALVTSAVYSYAHPTGTPESEVVGATRRAGRSGQGIRQGNDARYLALMHPPVALALAAVLDSAADCEDEVEAFDDLNEGAESLVLRGGLLRLARAILREES